jgi:hydroxyethylthiazole kinase
MSIRPGTSTTLPTDAASRSAEAGRPAAAESGSSPNPTDPGPLSPGAHLERLRAASPLVQCITNHVVTNITANVLLAQGSSPAMVDIPVEAGLFARIASGLLINLGTPTSEQRDAAREAAAAASEAGTPWVLDPVAIGALPVRTELAHELVALRPSVIRGNPSEILALAGTGTGGRGVDSVAGADDALDAARMLAREFGSVVAVSGAVDLVTDGERVARLANGTELLTLITGGGCALGATIAAYLAVAHDGDLFEATVAAVTNYTVAAEVAAEVAAKVTAKVAADVLVGSSESDPGPGRTRTTSNAADGDADGDAERPSGTRAGRPGPGSFAVAFLDALHALDAATVADRAVRS